jgi:hypothetical protein
MARPLPGDDAEAMRIFACMPWFDESPRWLASAVAGFAKLCDHVIAVDGAYFVYPEGRPASGGDQAETIISAARTAGIGCTVHVPQGVWMGNETEKRSCYAKIANALGTPYEDWLLVLDADEEVSEVSPLARFDLEQTDLDAAEIGMWTTDELRTWFGPSRRLYRLLPEMAYGPTHFSLHGRGHSGEPVWLNGLGEKYGEPLGDALSMVTQIRVEHKHHLRSETRAEKADVVGLLRPEFEPWPEPAETVKV